MPPSTPLEPVHPASVSHFIIFNPTLRRSPPKDEKKSVEVEEERDKDLEDDLKEASQILFYTSREGGRVSRDKMLRQYGLVKGLMGFTDMVLNEPGTGDKKGWWGVHSQKSRMMIWTPEKGFYIYINITLPYRSSGESVHGAQGISDQMIVAGLRTGYEDFKLLHGSLANADYSSNTTSANLERFWTRFAFHFESIYLSPSDPGNILPTWLGGYPSPPPDRTSKAAQAMISFSEHVIYGSITGLITQEGPLYTSHPIPDTLTRYLINALPTPPPVVTVTTSTSADRSTLGLGFGLGLRKRPKVSTSTSTAQEDERQSSWTSWVPTITTMGSGSSTPGSKEEETKAGSRWPSFGLGSLGMGSVFGAGTKSAEGINGEGNGNSAEPSTGRKAEMDTASVISTSSRQVEQSEVVLPDLQAAVDPNSDVELVWDKKDIWLETLDASRDYEKRRLSWIIRDERLLFIVFPPGAAPPFEMPPSKVTLDVFAALPDSIRASVDSSRPATPVQPLNSYIHRVDQTTNTQQGIDSSSAVTLSELREKLLTDPTVHEIYAKSSTGRFLVAKKTGEEELYMQIGRKDASLTDAEQAVKSIRAQ